MSGARPNIVYILADDLGYGDVACLNSRGKIPTPNFDRIASRGMTFTDAHGCSSVCSPSRYGILTGRYNWRSRLQVGVVNPYGPPIIDKDRLTVPALLGRNGYRTACIGKWHLGWDWPFAATESFRPGKTLPSIEKAREEWSVAFSKRVGGGPSDRGFDYSFGLDVPNWPPYAFMENGRLLDMPTEFLPVNLVGNNQTSMGGPMVAGWTLENVLPTLTDRACRYIAENTGKKEPFFLYMPLTSPHTPLAVNKEWRGKSGLNLYADFVMETDAAVGRVLDAIEKSGEAENTMVIFTADNGCAPYIGVPELEAKGHFPSAQFRGYKADAWDGGHRVPFLVSWPAKIRPSTSCDQTVCLNDLMATCADIVDAKLPEDAGGDSVSILPLLCGETRAMREELVHHSYHGKFAIRKGQWKLVLCSGSGGWTLMHDEGTPPGFAVEAAGKPVSDQDAERRGLPPVQLYDMESDPGERINLQDKHPDVVADLTRLIEKIVAEGRSTPGPELPNDVPVDLWKRTVWAGPRR